MYIYINGLHTIIHLENFQVANFNMLKLSSLKVIPSGKSASTKHCLQKLSSNPSKWHEKLDNWGYNPL